MTYDCQSHKIPKNHNYHTKQKAVSEPLNQSEISLDVERSEYVERGQNLYPRENREIQAVYPEH